jgi:hypothetical protein
MDNPDGGLSDDFQPLPQPLQHHTVYNLQGNAFAQVDGDLRRTADLDRGEYMRTHYADLAGAGLTIAALLPAQ